MTLNIDQIQEHIRSGLHVSVGREILPAQVVAAVNDAYRDIALFAFCVENTDTLYTTPGSRFVAVSGHKVVRVLLGEQGLLQVDPRLFGHIQSESTTPKYWFQWGDQIALDPVPDSVHALRVFMADYPSEGLRRPLVIFADTTGVQFTDAAASWNRTSPLDYPEDLPEEFRSVIIPYCLCVLSLKLKRWESAAGYYNRYLNELINSRNSYIMRLREMETVHNFPSSVE